MSEEKTDESGFRQAPILVNGEEVPEALIDQELEMLLQRYAQEMDRDELEQKRLKIESDARENAVERILLTQKARTEPGLVRPEEVDARFLAFQHQHGGPEEFDKQFDLSAEDIARIKADIEDSVRLEKYFDLLCKDVPRPVEADSRAYYDAHPDEFTVPEMVHASHIVQSPSPESTVERVYADLLNARERLMKGDDFYEVAAAFSHCQDGGHDLGYFARGHMVPAFEQVAFSTPVNEVSDVFQSAFGYHILKVHDRKDAGVRAFEEVRYDIESMLFDERKNQAIGEVADGLRAEADIQNLEIVEDE